MPLTLAIVGRPNVGKSTLFNRLVGKRLAIVDDLPGVTRDRREGEGRIADLAFRLIDTAGLEEAEEGSLSARMQIQTERALEDADAAILIIDGRAGVLPEDKYFADRLRRYEKPVLLAVNKCESRAARAGLYEAFELGLGEPIAISAAHGEGLAELREAVLALEDDGVAEATPDELELQLAIVGRPNAGKSTLINRMLGEERLLVGPEPGITRDAIGTHWSWRDQAVRLIDTAGMRKRPKVTGQLEKLSVADALRAVDYAQVVVLLSDATAPLERQDLAIARRVIDEGRALVIALNKWDLVSERSAVMREMQQRVADGLSQAKGVPIITLSGLTGRGLDKLMPAVMQVYEKWGRQVSTSALNRWLEVMVTQHPPPLGQHGRRIRLRYATQARTRPPSFILFCNRPEDLPEAYQRYLQNGLRDAFDLDGVPLRLWLRRSDNPYAGRKK